MLRFLSCRIIPGLTAADIDAGVDDVQASFLVQRAPEALIEAGSAIKALLRGVFASLVDILPLAYDGTHISGEIAAGGGLGRALRRDSLSPGGRAH